MKNGVTYYEIYEIKVKVGFPNGDVCCKNCWLCVKDPNNYARLICFATGQMIPYPECGILPDCPAQKIKKEE